MARKPRKDPITEGSLKLIYKYFFGPLVLKHKPLDLSISDFMDQLFDRTNRDIFRYIVKKSFKMPGLLYTAPAVKIQGLGYRDVKADAILYVRKNLRSPNVVDVEWLGGQGNKEQVFCLTESEWNGCALNCHETEWHHLKCSVCERVFWTEINSIEPTCDKCTDVRAERD